MMFNQNRQGCEDRQLQKTRIGWSVYCLNSQKL